MDELKALLAKAAPWLAAAAGGPAGLAAQAIKTAAEALGASNDTIQGVTSSLTSASAEQLGALKLAEQGFQERMQALGFQSLQAMEALATADRASARAMQVAKPSNVPAVLTACVSISFLTTMVLLIFNGIPLQNKDTVLTMIGILGGAFTSVLAYWVGTTSSSGVKTKLIAQADAVK